MVCSTRTGGAAASRGSANRRVDRRRTLHSILAHYTYENVCFCSDGGGHGGVGPIFSPERVLSTDARRPECGGLLVSRRQAPDLSDDASALRLRSDFHHERRRHATSTWSRPARAGPRAAISCRTASTSSTDRRTWRAMPARRRRTAARATCGRVFTGYDIFEATDAGKIEKRLTDAPGYDAEATVNWKTGNIVYTSMASGDLDLWTMKTDGSGKKQITKSPGYDGGAVFSRDGKMLVWRAGYPKNAEQMAKYKELLAENLTTPMKMELMVADADGSNQKTAHRFRLRQFRAHVHAGRQEDSVLVEQAGMRQPEVRTVSDQRGRHRAGAGDEASADSPRSPSSRRTARRWCSAPTRTPRNATSSISSRPSGAISERTSRASVITA